MPILQCIAPNGKGRGRYKIFEPAMLESVMSHLELETDLRKALKKKGVYRPLPANPGNG